ncbi:MAG TPA: phage holin family protein [Salinimicrobium sp.]|nr:phage holin family protein [Salinimicrobium sp.]
MAFENLTDNAKELYENVQDAVKSNIEYYKLNLFKKASLGAIALTKLLVMGSVFLFAMTFVSVGIALFIGDSIDSFAAGFIIVGVFYLLVVLLVYLFLKPAIDQWVIKKFYDIFYTDKD